MDAQLRELEFMDVHVGAEVHRVVLDGIPRLPGESVREQARYLEREADGLRRLLLEEPRGALPSFSVDLVTRAGNPRAHAGVIIMEYMGYPMFSGSNLMATATALVETGRIALPGNMGTVALESPGGLARVRVERGRNRVESTRYESSSPAFVASRGHEVHLTSYGRVRFDVVWSGVFYAVVDARVHGFSLLREEEAALGRLGAALIESARTDVRPRHPELGDTGALSFVLFVHPPRCASDGTHERRLASYCHPGSLCRCPSGTGTTAAMAELYESGALRKGDSLRATSWFDTCFTATLEDIGVQAGRTALRVAVEAHPWVIASGRLIVHRDDPTNPPGGVAPLFKATEKA